MINVQAALKAAIEAIEVTGLREYYLVEALEKCKSALAELNKCEPFGWLFVEGVKVHFYKNKYPEATFSEGFIEKYKDNLTPIYTSPQPRDWVGLRDEDIPENASIQFKLAMTHAELILKQLNKKG